MRKLILALMALACLSCAAVAQQRPTSTVDQGKAGSVPWPISWTGQSVLADLRVGGSPVASGNPVPVAAASLPLPAGAAQDSTLTARLGTLGQKAMAASAPVAIASDQGAVPVGVAPTSQAASALTPINYVGGSAFVVKPSAGNLYGYDLTQGGTGGYFVFLDLAAAPAAGASITPKMCVPVAANGYVARRQDIPDRYVNGLVIVSSTSCLTYTSVVATVMAAVIQ